MDTFQDSRFQTFNTNQAACMGALRIPIKQQQPVTVYINSETKERRIVFSFESQGHPFLEEIHEPARVNWAWKNRSEFEGLNPDHPLIPMRRALEKREWLVGVWHGRITYTETRRKPLFATKDIDFASCLMALGCSLIRIEKPNYVFGEIPANAIADYEDYLSRESTHAALMHRALEARNLFGALVKLSQGNKDMRDPYVAKALMLMGDQNTGAAAMEYFNGDPNEGGKVAHIPVGTNPEETNELLSELYS